jgi:hypothetical protein
VRKTIFICLCLWFCGLAAFAETFQLIDGKEITGEPLTASANDAGLQIKVAEGQYERVPWGNFSQEALKKFQATPRLAPLVEPFIEITQEEKLKKTEVKINPVSRLQRPEARSLFAAMTSSGLGILMLLLLYAANLYAAFEVAIFRARPIALVCGVSAVLPFVGPVIFLSMPTLMPPQDDVVDPTAPNAAIPVVVTPDDTSPLAQEHPVSAGGLHISHTPAGPAGTTLPPTQTFQRGAFTFNRRFFETKFAGFFGVVRREGEKDMLLVIRSARGEYHGTRVSRITSNDLHLQVVKGGASEEVLIPFTEIKEVQLKHKDAQ